MPFTTGEGLRRLPIIDMSALCSADPLARSWSIAQLREACEARGFFYIRNHGIPPALVERVFAATRAFFAQPMSFKLAVSRTQSPANRGYDPLRVQTLEQGAPADLKESFLIGNELAADDPRVLAGRFNAGPNQWPAGLADFRESMNEYFDLAGQLAAQIVRALEASLALPPGYFEPYLHDASSILRPLHYPPQPANPQPREKGCGEHTDFGGVTLLMQDDVGGLEVWDAEHGAWIDAPPLPGTYVVNIGDLFARWTNGRYRSTLHRVVNTSGRERYSVPFFLVGNFEYVVECLPTCLDSGDAAPFAPVTVQQHIQACYRKSYV